MMRGRHFIVLFLGIVLVTLGCGSMLYTPKVTTSCGFDQAWSVALASVDEFEIRRIDQEDGLIETEWIGLASKTKSGFSLFESFARDSNQERARFFINITPEPPGTHIVVQQDREIFSSMGVQSQSNPWRRIPPIEEEEQRLANRISNQLRAKGCTILS